MSEQVQRLLGTVVGYAVLAALLAFSLGLCAHAIRYLVEAVR